MDIKQRKVYFNGKFVNESEAKISIYDSALMFGDMVFEMTRSFNKKQFKLREHIDRLYMGLKIFKIKINLTKLQLEDECYRTIEMNEDIFNNNDEHRLMINVSRGLLGIYHGIEGLDRGPNIIIADFPLKWTVRGMGILFDEGINAVITPQRVIPSDLLDPKIKNRSRVHYMMANMQASQIKGKNNWALMLDPDGFVAEGTGDNFFIIKNNKLFTPEGRNILKGISREYVIEELCSQLNLECYEKNFEVYDIYSADEAFMTGTPFCMLPVTSINGTKIGDGKVGRLYNRLLTKWCENTNIDISNQIKSWNRMDLEDDLSLSVTPYQFEN